MAPLPSPRPRATLVVLALTSSFGCDSKPPEEAPPAPPALVEARPSPSPVAATPEPAQPPAAVEPVEWMIADPADAPVELVEGGRVLDQVGWTDGQGRHLVFLVRHDRPEGEYASTATLTIARYLIEEGGADAGVAFTLNEEGAETVVVEKCEFDVVMEPVLGEWSVTDLDADGVGELTLAWTADCTSDISPDRHVVVLNEGGVTYALRGVSRVDPGGGPIGGEFEADEAFAEAPEAFRAHAEEVWGETSGR